MSAERATDGPASGGTPGFLTAEQALQFLDHASEVLARSLDYEHTLNDVARLAVPDLADWCAIDIVQPDGSTRQITSRHPDPEQEELLMELRRRFRANVKGSAGAAKVIASGEPEHVYDTGDQAVTDLELSEEELKLYARLHPRSYVIVPLITRARTVGALTLLSTRDGRHYGERDVEFAHHLARRFALAIDNARLFDESLEARRRAEFLVRAGEILSASLDYEETLQNVAAIAVPELADWCTVQLVEDDNSIRQVAVAHADPAKIRYARELQERFPPDPDAPQGAASVIRTGQTEVTEEITDELIDALVDDLELRQIVRELGLRATITAPLRAHGRVFGALMFVSAESGRRFTAEDVALVEELARRAGTAVDNARLYTEGARIAHTLQVELLPTDLPEIPFLEVAVRYRAAGELNEVGGDFYDIFPSSADGEWMMVIGDVSGKGAEAAAVTALARYTLHAAALESSDPSELLSKLNAALMVQRRGRDFCTACVARIRPAEDVTKVCFSIAGHPPPVVMRSDGRTEMPGEPGTLLGIFEDPELVNCEVDLAEGDTILLYTDGVIEAGRPVGQLGEEGLAEALEQARPASAAEAVDVAETIAIEVQDGPVRDDIALVAVRMGTPVAAAMS
ncbi:MAG TPA: GAF domain-containing SpoIIE family protein phosphatase [Thermoleophilaceae bacterium]|nr:GAF domain-containing SpoIIE family protein phosphatase [Thermoleophilaceae bacterium]